MNLKTGQLKLTSVKNRMEKQEQSQGSVGQHICIVGIPEGGEKGKDRLFGQIITENFQNLCLMELGKEERSSPKITKGNKL